ncbi:ATP-binding protein [Thauera sp. Sel9]|uniref:ATP-binding protein n=1 Tax=Thauera sp. Sel9 TaxID=2974299 RepID=UPI0021E19CC2|nr:ATP-binding protein [Thauera sp. Sel9]MCV2219802.1 ATP-binding protein [Thauera sp. Sel9]
MKFGRLLPRSLVGQLIGLLLAGIIAAHLIALPLDGTGTGRVLPHARDNALERIATAYRVTEACGDCDVAAVLEAMTSHDAEFSLKASAPRAFGETNAELATQLTTLAGLPANAAVHVYLEDKAPDPDTLSLTRRPHAVLDAALPLADGRWLVANLRPTARYQWWRPLPVTLFVSVLPVLLIVSLFARYILRPTKALADAAERVSRGERIDPLPVSGPAELREATAAFNTMQERLTRFVSDRTAMLAAIGHDFRTPLASLRLQVELLDDEAVRQPMRRILDTMRDMIDETLRFARDDSVREPTREVDLSVLVVQAGEERVSLGQPVSWRVPETLPYRCRPLALSRALGNLIDNAVRYGGNAHVSLDLHPDGSRLSIAVDDDGPGIPENWLERVFEPFARPSAARSQDSGGIGLGLAIARSCIAAHGGEIQLTNRPAGGLSARITLPA